MAKVLPAALAAFACACGSNGSPRPVTRITYSIDLEKAVDELRAHPDDPVDERAAASAKATALRQAVETIRARIDGVAGARVAAEGERIVVDLPALGDDAQAAVKDVVARTGELVVKVVDEDSPPMRRIAELVDRRGADADPAAVDAGITAHGERWIGAHGETVEDRYLTAADREAMVSIEEARRRGCFNRDLTVRDGRVACRQSGRQMLADYLRELAEREPAARVPDDREIGYERIAPPLDGTVPGDRGPRWRTYYLERPARLTGREIANASVTRSPTTGRPELLLILDDGGRERLAALTRETLGKKLAIAVDDVVQSAPIVREPLTSGMVTLPLGATASDPAAEARELARVLRAGALPAPLREESITELGPATP